MPFIIGRRAKDAQAMQQAQQTGGSVTIRSKNKIANPTSPGRTLPRGSQVTYTKTPTVTKAPDTVTPGKRSVTVSKTTRDVYHPGDMQGNKVHDRPTTMALGKSMREAPAKTSQRMSAQSEGKTQYTTPSGKTEYSGRIEKRHTYETKVTKEPDRMKIGKVSMGQKTTASVIQPAVKKPSDSRGHKGLIIHHSAGTNRQGKPQNFTSVELGGKKLMKFKRATPGQGRSRSLRK